ncbi:MAG: (d)CMP kinase [Fimbriimonadaceae bacterium]|nr:(d)CMP kinase [Fimbriimonadaceae bacterium]
MIAIDGPAGAGKSTAARLTAQRLGLRLLDTGAMYRCVALAGLAEGLSGAAGEEEAIGDLAARIHIDFLPSQPEAVLLDGQDVASRIRSNAVGQAASRMSVYPRVRRAMVARQKEIIASGGVVLEGRDTTTVVAPEADVKVFLTASVEERARRRWLEQRRAGSQHGLHEVAVEVLERDLRDYSREDSPLMLAEDAVIIESFGLSPDQVVDRIIELLAAPAGGGSSS